MGKKYVFTNSLMVGSIRMVTKAKGYRFKIAETEQELQAVYDLRLRIYQQEVIHDSHPYPDEFDPHAVILIAYKRRTPVATMRLVRAEKGNITTELYCPDLLNEISPRNTVEIGGLAIEKAHRGGSNFVFVSLLHLGLEWCASNHRQNWIGISTLKKLELFKALNPNLLIRVAVKEALLDSQNQARRKENDQIQVRGKKPYPFVIDISSVNYWGAVRYYIGKLFRRENKESV